MEKKKIIKKNIEKKPAEALCTDRFCSIHGKLRTRGRKFKGHVIKKFDKRVVILVERMIFIRKYERYAKARTKIHARLPECLADKINIGDYIEIMECRPLSKIIHHVVIGKIKSGGKI